MKFRQDVKTWIKEMEKTKTGDIPLGYKKIRDNLCWNEGRARKVFETLKKMGKIEVINGEGTKIVEKGKRVQTQ